MRAFALVVALLLLAAPAAAELPAPPANPPTKTEADEAKKRFDAGIKLYAEGAFEAALVAFEASYRLSGRPSALRNIAQCHRDLLRFAEAYDAYDALLARHQNMLKPDELANVTRAKEELALLTGVLMLSVSEAGVKVEIDDRPAGEPPLAIRISVGPHRLRIVKQGFETYEREIAVSSGASLAIDVTLQREAATGRVAVRERDGDPVRVLVDGKDVGPAPWEGELDPGEHRVGLGGERFAADSQRVQVSRGGDLDLVLDAITTRARLRITTIPSSAAISVDGERRGSGAWEGELPPGDHQIEVSHEGAETIRRTITLTRGQSLVQEIPLPDIATLEEPPDYVGFYGRGNLFFAPGVHSLEPSTTLDSDRGIPINGGVTIRAGYSFGLLAVEVAGGFSAGQIRSETIQLPDDREGVPEQNRFKEEIHTFSPAGFIGVGGRITSPHPYVRFTFGADLGIAIRSLSMNVNHVGQGFPELGTCTGEITDEGGCRDEFDAFYVAPALQLDGGMLIGSTPGAKFFLGAITWIEFPTDDELAVGPDNSSVRGDETFLAPGRGYYMAREIPVYIGPVLGVQIGH